MARIRSLKAEFFRDAEISRGLVVKILAAGLICAVADDDGRFKVDARVLKAEVFTHDTVTVEEVGEALTILDRIGFIRLYHQQGQAYGAIRTWTDHQRVPKSHYTSSKLPAPNRKYRPPIQKNRPPIQKNRPPIDVNGCSFGTFPNTKSGFAPKQDRIGKDRIGKDRIGGDARPREAALQPLAERQLVSFSRIDLLADGCRDLLKRDLKTTERAVVMGWAELERNGELVSTNEILDHTKRLLSKPARDGTLPGGLAYCNDSVMALARAPLPRNSGLPPKQQGIDERIRNLAGGDS